jgi:hypothetical protein
VAFWKTRAASSSATGYRHPDRCGRPA